MKKFLLGLFALSFVFIAVACGGDSEWSIDDLPEPRFTPNAAIPSWQTDVDFTAELSWYVNYLWWPEHNMGDSWVTEQMFNDLNVRIHWTSGNTEMLNAMIAGGDLPDIITVGGYMADIVSEAHEFAIPLNVLADMYDPYFFTAVSPQVRAWMTRESGNIYGLPNEAVTSEEISAGAGTTGAGFLVRGDIYEAIGSPDMTTPEGFLQALRDAVAHSPQDSHGRPLVGFSGDFVNISTVDNGAFSGVLQDFLAIPVLNADGTWYDRDSHPAYLEWMLVFRQAMDEGLMSMDQFSHDNETVNNEFETGRYFAIMTGNTNDFASRMNNIAGGDTPEQQMIPIYGPRNNGASHTLPAGSINGWTHTFITQNARDPQTAIQVITYLWSDHGQMLQQFGIEGVTYTYVNGVPTWNEDIAAHHANDYYDFRDVWGMRTFWQLRRPGFFANQGVVPVGTPHAEVQTFYIPFNHPRLEFVNLEPTSGQIQRDLEAIDLARSQAIADLLTASSDAEATQIWENFLSFRDNYDWNSIVEYRNRRLNENRAQLGMN